MANWVYNTLTVMADDEKDIQEFLKIVSRPIPRMESLTTEIPTELEEVDFSFWNIISPPIEIWEEYFSPSSGGDKDNGWYEWNCRNWGSKWDACEVCIDDNGTEATISFQTAWSPVENVIDKMSLQFRHLSFHYSYEEENGWGGEVTYEAGETRDKSEYDEPASHEDYVNRGRVEDCACGWNEHPDEWFDDCPKTEVAK